MDLKGAADNARSQLPQECCSAATKYRGWLVICDQQLRHTGEHSGICPDGSTYAWTEEPW